MLRFDRRIISSFDWISLILLLIILGIGLLNLYSSTWTGTSPSTLFTKQLILSIVGIVTILFMLLFDYSLLKKTGYVIHFLIILLLAYTTFMAGDTIAGTQRWIRLGFFNLQPSELAKLSLVIVLASCYATHEAIDGYTIKDLIKPFLLAIIPFILIVLQPDLGTAGMMAIIAVSMTAIVKIRKHVIAVILCMGLVGIPLYWHFVMDDYQKKRVETFINPDADPMGQAYQIKQSIIAIGSGGLLGKGFKEGTQGHLHFLPERHTDFAFAIWAEEWGFVGSIILLACYLLLLVWGLNVAMTARDKFGMFMAFGLIALIFWQAVINLFMVMGWFPVVGIPMPLISYGGSSLLVTIISFGLLINIRSRKDIPAK